jgi:hypothetical protein
MEKRIEPLKFSPRKAGLLGALRQRKNPLCSLSFQEKSASLRFGPSISQIHLAQSQANVEIDGSIPLYSWKFAAWVVWVFLIQYVVLLVAGKGERVTPRKDENPIRITMASQGSMEPWINQSLKSELSDPSLFALPNSVSFSGTAWGQFPTLGYQWDVMDFSSMSGAMDLEGLGSGFLKTIEDQPVKRPSFNSPSQDMVRPTIPNQTSNSNQITTYLELSGALSARRLVSFIAIPVWKDIGLIGPTRIELAVDVEGRVASVLLLAPGSGSKVVDSWALNAIQSARFSPLESLEPQVDSSTTDDPALIQLEGLTIGKVIFHWGITSDQPQTKP